MSGLSWRYAARNLAARRMTTLLTAFGMALVVFVFAAVLMMAAGLQKTLSGTGSPDNLVILRDGAQTEVQSVVERDQASLVAALPGLATDAAGDPLVARETVVLVNLPKPGEKSNANVPVRGAEPGVSLVLRPQVKITAGRAFRPDAAEILVGSAIARGQGLDVGSTLRFGLRDWTVVGIFDAGGSGFDSEIWAHNLQVMQTFRRPAYTSLVARTRDAAGAAGFVRELTADPRYRFVAKVETQFYADQSKALAKFIGVLGQTITAVFSIGAIIGATITMYAAVASRTREIGALRALGFHRAAIVRAFMQEAVLLGAVAGVVGLVAASALSWVEISTTNFQTFSEIVFELTLTPAVVAQGFLFALFMGVAGGSLPALRAARLEIVEALRA